MDMNASGMGALLISVYKKIWCSTIRGCSAINIISRSKDKTLQIVPQCSTNRVNAVIVYIDIKSFCQ